MIEGAGQRSAPLHEAAPPRAFRVPHLNIKGSQNTMKSSNDLLEGTQSKNIHPVFASAYGFLAS